MENYIPENTCRTCLQQSDELISLYTEDDDTGLTLLEKLRFCVSMQVLVSERTPSNACAPCVRNIAEFCDFKRRCELSEKALEGMCGERQEYALPKTEVVYMEEDGGGDSKIVTKIEPEESKLSFDDGSDWRDSLDDEEKVDAKRGFKCDGCSELFETELCMQEHYARDHQEQELPCDVEDSGSQNISTVNMHDQLENANSDYEQHGTKDKKLSLKKTDDLRERKRRPCDECSGSYLYLKQHKFHCHSGRKHVCKLCGVAYSLAQNLRRHMTNKHKTTNKYVCETCGKSYSFQHTLRNHIMENHSTEKPVHACNLCGKTYSVLASLYAHKRSHVPDLHLKCDYCEKTYPNKVRLAQHVRVTHGKSYACDECDKRFFTSPQLLKHKAVHALYASRPHVCKVCDKRFPTTSSLGVHMSMMHRGKKHLNCDVCGLEFYYRSHYAAHYSKHTGVKPCRCDGCGKGYSYNHDLKMHKKTCAAFLELTPQ